MGVLTENHSAVLLRKPTLRELVPVPIDLIRKDEKLPYPVYLKILERPVLFRSEGDEITSGRAVRLKEKIDAVCIPRSALSQLIQKQELSLGSTDDTTSDTDFAFQLRNLMIAISREVESQHDINADYLAKVQRLASTLAGSLKKRPDLSAKLIRRYSDSSLYYVSHSVNVAIYSVMIGIKLNLSLERLKVLAFGSLVHNVGNIFVPEEILFKSAPLTVGEWRKVQDHPQKGAKLLEAFGVGPEVVQMIWQHHERMDGKGYPIGLAGNQIHLFSRICSIADVYDALTSTRPYRRSVSPFEAVQIMRQMTGKFDPNILRVMEGT